MGVGSHAASAGHSDGYDPAPPRRKGFSLTVTLRCLIALTLGAPLLSASVTVAQAPTGEDKDSALYSIGVLLSRQLGPLGLNEAEVAQVQAGLGDAVLGKALRANPEDHREHITALHTEREKATSAKERAEAEKFLAAAEAKSGSLRTDSGLIYREEKAGSGASPTPADTVSVHYHGTLRDGSVFDSSVERGTPAKFPLNRVIPCWTEGLQRMKVGGKSVLVCPSAIAYGDSGSPPKIKGGAALSFEVELLAIEAPQ